MNKAREKLSLLRELLAPKNYFALLMSLGLLTLMSAFTTEGPFSRITFTLLAFSVVTSIGVAVSSGKRLALGMLLGGLLVSVMIIVGSVYLVAPLHNKFFQMASYVFATVYLFLAAITILKDVFSGQVNANRICGAICFYVLIGMCFSMLFFTLDIHDPTSFKVERFYDGTPKEKLPITKHDRFTLFNYFSFCTLSTAGFGDITPVSQAARTFSWVEAVFGQLYLSILVARLVGLHIAGATASDTKQEPSIQTD